MTTSSKASSWPTTNMLDRFLEGDVPSAGGARAHARGWRRGPAQRLPGRLRICQRRTWRSTVSPTSSARSARLPPTGPASRSRPAPTTQDIAPDVDGQPLAFVFKTDRRPVRRPALVVQGAVGNREARRSSREPADRLRRAAARALRAAWQRPRSPVNERPGRRPRRGPEAVRDRDRGDMSAPERHAGPRRDDRATSPGARQSRSRLARKPTTTSSGRRSNDCRRQNTCSRSSAATRRSRRCFGVPARPISRSRRCARYSDQSGDAF